MPIKTYDSDDALDREVHFVMYQHIGQDNGITRWSLVERIFGSEAALPEVRNDNNPYDRQVRDSIERWRNKGHRFCNMGTGKGYFVAATREEYRAFKKYYLGAAFNKIETVKQMDESADQEWGKEPKPASPLQVSFFGG